MTLKLFQSLAHLLRPQADKSASLPAESQLSTLKLGYLSEIEIFRDLSPAEMDWVAAITTMTTCQRGRVFYTPGETGEVLFLIKHGRVQLYRLSTEGKKLILASFGAGAIFGEMSMLGQGMHHTFAEAIEDCLLCVMGRADLERLITEKPRVAIRLIEVLGRRVRELETQVEDIAFKSMKARLAARLLRLQQEEGGQVLTRYTHQDLADMIGAYRETATQVLNEMRGEGLIDIGRKRIVILDAERLTQIAEG